MGTVQIAITGTLSEVEEVRHRMEQVLLVTGGEQGSDQRVMHADGAVLYLLAVSADDPPGGADAFEFSRIKDPAVYVHLRDLLNEASRVFTTLKAEGVLNPVGQLARTLEVFRAKMDDYLRGLEG